jgi:hypothetical protein
VDKKLSIWSFPTINKKYIKQMKILLQQFIKSKTQSEKNVYKMQGCRNPYFSHYCIEVNGVDELLREHLAAHPFRSSPCLQLKRWPGARRGGCRMRRAFNCKRTLPSLRTSAFLAKCDEIFT